MRAQRALVVGAGIGGLAAALDLCARGVEVRVLERAPAPGGKMREVAVAGRGVDSGPTVLTMRSVFDALFDAAGADLSARVGLTRVDRLARHAWGPGETLDLYSDIDRSAEAIGDFAGAREAAGYRAFAERARAIHQTLENSFIQASRPSLVGLMRRVGLSRMGELLRISPFATLWGALGDHFRDPRLRQMFARYATYCGSSPFAAPATLMLVAHVEREGVWLVEGGMQRLSKAMARLAEERGVRIDYGVEADRLLVEGGGAAGVETTGGERIAADVVIFNGDVSALGRGRLGESARKAAAPAKPSLSAITWSAVGRVKGFPLVRHNVLFGDSYREEFTAIFASNQLPRRPTVYVCAQDRGEEAQSAGDPERLFLLVNAPAERPGNPLSSTEIDTCERATFQHLNRCGLTFKPTAMTRTTPAMFAALFPGSQGALYGPPSHGWRASFARSGAETAIPGLFLAGGSVHPGPGVPMAALSGRLAASAAAARLASIRKFHPAAMPGGTSTRSARRLGSA